MKYIYPPLKITQDLSKQYSGCWDKVEVLRNEFKHEWPWWCYIPIGACQAITGGVDNSAPLAAAASWRQNKAVYQFDEDMEKLLFTQADEKITVPVDIFDKMPYQCIYIETKTKIYHGIWVFREFDVNTEESELRFVAIDDDGHWQNGFIMHIIPGAKISECIEATHIKVEENLTKYYKESPEITLPLRTKMMEYKDAYDEEIITLLQLVLYICSENADINENQMQKSVHRRDKTIKDAYREIRKWDVGFKIGTLVRASSLPGKSTASKGGSSKRPHSRRGHWAHYHVGVGRKETILKWVAPTFVNADKVNIDNLPVTITKLNKKEK